MTSLVNHTWPAGVTTQATARSKSKGILLKHTKLSPVLPQRAVSNIVCVTELQQRHTEREGTKKCQRSRLSVRDLSGCVHDVLVMWDTGTEGPQDEGLTIELGALV